MPARDLVDLARQLPRDSAIARLEDGDLADWSLGDHNLADLVDVLSAYLQYEYSRWTTDPEDPEFQREQKQRRAAGIKPPPTPLIPPVAARPARLADVRQAAYERLAASFHSPAPDRAPAAGELMSLDAWDAALGL